MLSPRITRAALLPAVLLAATAAAQPRAQLAPCTLPGLDEPARCGTVRVPENRDRPGGRMLDLNVLVVPAPGGQPARYAMIFFAGGPGQAVVEGAGFVPGMYAGVREGRDLLFVDQRGTGRSASLACSLRDPANPQSYLDDFLPPARVAACRDSLARIADLTRYTFPDLAHDTEAVRVALGYEKLDLEGGSMGTRAAQVYQRMYPGSVRTMVLHGLVPPGFLLPESYARDTDAALAGLARLCRQDAACAAAFPDPVGEARAVARRLETQPAEAEVLDPGSGRLVRLRMGRGTFAETIRKMMYDPTSASLVPFVVRRAFQGDYRPLIRYGLADRLMGGDDVSWGLFLALTCTEDVPFIDRAAAAAENERTVLGDYRVRQQAAACEGWPRGTIPADYHQVVPSDVPVLMVSGEFDPVTPASGGPLLMQAFRNGRHIVIPGAAHGYGGMEGIECVDSIAVRFVRQGSHEGLDTSCLGRIRRPPFVLDVPEPIALDAAALQRFAGSYASPEMEMQVEVRGPALFARAANFETVALPISPTRFAPEGMPPGFQLEFAPDASSVTLHVPGRPDLVMPRRP